MRARSPHLPGSRDAAFCVAWASAEASSVPGSSSRKRPRRPQSSFGAGSRSDRAQDQREIDDGRGGTPRNAARHAAQQTRPHSRQAGVRSGNLRRLHRNHRRQGASTPAPCWPSTPRARKSRHSKASPRATSRTRWSAAFVDNDAQQCGYCTPGFVVASKAFLDKNPESRQRQISRTDWAAICVAAAPM